jgi:hypothetical protein
MAYRTREQLVSTTAHAICRPGKPPRPKYDLYDLWRLPGYHAFNNEVDELLERWPVYQARTVALLAVRQAFFINGATHWEVESYQAELLVNPDVAACSARKRAREAYPALVARHERNLALAEAALVERERRKQGTPTGKTTRRPPQAPRFPKGLLLAPAKAVSSSRPVARPRYRAEQLMRDPLAYQASLNELDALLEQWPAQQSRILHLLAVHRAMVMFYGRLSDESQMLDPGNPAHYADRAQRMARAAARDADPQRAARYQQALRQARAYIPAPETRP